jgi:hypothetical protein
MPANFLYFVSGSSTTHLSFFLPPTHLGDYFLGVFMTATTSFSVSLCPKDPSLPSLTDGVTYNRTLDSTDDYYYLDIVNPNLDVVVIFLNDYLQGRRSLASFFLLFSLLHFFFLPVPFNLRFPK